VRSRNVILFLMLVALGGQISTLVTGRDKDKRDELREDLRDVARKLNRRLRVSNPSEDNVFLNQRASEILNRANQARQDFYRCGRLVKAADHLLEASENVFEAREPDRDREDDDRKEAALRLQRYYFRVQQADYFAGLSGEEDAEAYVKRARSLYHRARSAYDSQQYHRARKLGEAAEDIVSALEKLAQASVRVPEPPRLK
jgi:hypothetical protein